MTERLASGSISLNWTSEVISIKSEGTAVLEEMKTQTANHTKVASPKQMYVNSKLYTTAVPLLERIVEVYGDGAKILSNTPEYDVCLKLKHDVELILKSDKDKFTAKYHFMLDGAYNVEGFLYADERLYPETPINEENLKNIVKAFLKEYNTIVALIEKRKLAEAQKRSVAVKC